MWLSLFKNWTYTLHSKKHIASIHFNIYSTQPGGKREMEAVNLFWAYWVRRKCKTLKLKAKEKKKKTWPMGRMHGHNTCRWAHSIKGNRRSCILAIRGKSKSRSTKTKPSQETKSFYSKSILTKKKNLPLKAKKATIAGTERTGARLV